MDRQYGVNEKTVRDIWARRTWKQETLPLGNKELKNGAKIGLPLEYRDSALRQQTESVAENSPQSNIHRASAGLSANSIAAGEACADTWGNITVTPEAECCAYDSAYRYKEVAYDSQLQDTKMRRLQQELTEQQMSSLLLPLVTPLTSDRLGQLLPLQVPFCLSLCAMLPPLNLTSTPAHSLCHVQAAVHPLPSQAAYALCLLAAPFLFCQGQLWAGCCRAGRRPAHSLGWALRRCCQRASHRPSAGRSASPTRLCSSIKLCDGVA